MFVIFLPKLNNKFTIWRWMRGLSLHKHQKTFNQLFQGIEGFTLSKIARQMYDAPQYTYGEILFLPFIALLSQTNIDKNSVFYDLGSGIGKAVIACSLVFEIKKYCGVEFFENLHTCALQKQNILTSLNNYKNKANKIKFINNDFLNIDFADATLIFINATAFFGEIWEQLNTKLTQINGDLTIITISKKITAKNFKLAKSTHVEMSWGIATAHIYVTN